MSNTIKIKKYVDIVEELVANAAITPGMLLNLRSDGKVEAHGTASGNALPMFALENELFGKTIDDDYAANDQVQVWVPVRGEMVYGILAMGENVSVGALLVSNGNGHLKAESNPVTPTVGDPLPYPNRIVGQAVEAVNATSAVKRIIIRII